MSSLGNTDLLERHLVAFFASRSVTSEAERRCIAWAESICNTDSVVISGFHSPLEKKILNVLLEHKHPVVLFLGRSMYKRIPAEYQEAIDEGYSDISPLELISNARCAALSARPTETREVIIAQSKTDSLRGDEKWLTQALVNLISNALSYSSGEGSVVISVICSEKTVIFRITNPGEISGEVAENMFRRFYRKSADQKGFGLGLSIAQSIARLHKGDLRAESAEGKTTLVLTISKNDCADSI